MLNDDEIAAYGEVDSLVKQGIVGSQKLRADYAEMIVAERHLHGETNLERIEAAER